MSRVVVNLMGGLGNQMFQYATGRSLSLRSNSELYLDHTFLNQDPKGVYTKRNYELSVFNVSAIEADEKILSPYTKLHQSGVINKIFNMIGGSFPSRIFNENGFNFNNEFNSLSGNVYLHGFWQTEKYFSSIRSILLDDFSLKIKLGLKAMEILNTINCSEVAISIHFRRGDYVSLNEANNFHGTTPVEYYKMAVNRMNLLFPNAYYFLFSDEPEWVKENFKLVKSTLISGMQSYEDLFLMSSCHHHIIANSSFSWWSAWLNRHEFKKVIAPAKWFNDISKNTSDLIPETWEKI